MKLSCRGMRFLPRQPGRTLRPTYNGWKLGDTTDEPAPWRAVWSRSAWFAGGGRRGTASLLGAATHPLGAMPGGCREGRGGFRFPWIGVWSRRHCVAMPGATAAQAWIAYHGSPSPMERLSLEWLALPGTEARPLLIHHDERLNLHQPGPGALLCVAIGCLERAPYRCRRCRAPLCGGCGARGCELCGQPGSSHWLRVGHGV